MKTQIKTKPKIKETDLYLPVKKHFEQLGYTVKGEVKDCDIVAVKDNELIIIELKTGFTTKLLFQAIDRLKIADKVYMAIPSLKWNRKDFHRILYVAKTMNIGLITIKTKTNEVFIDFEPISILKPKKNIKKNAVLNEMEDRLSDLNIGGTNKEKIITAYMEKSVYAAIVIMNEGSVKPKRLREAFGFNQKHSTNIFKTNPYNWFENKERGVFILTKKGQKDILENHKNLYLLYTDLYFKKIKEEETLS